MLRPVLAISTNGYDAWHRRPPQARLHQDREVMQRTQAIHEASRGTYGVPRVWVELRRTDAIGCSRERMAHLMRQLARLGMRWTMR